MVPLALFGISIAAAALPEFSRDTATVAHQALLERLRGGWARILFYILPTTAAFLLYGDLLVGLLYRSGKFGAAEQRIVHWILGAYAVGLVGFSSVKLLASAFYALQDYRTPLRASVLSLVTGTIASIALALPLRASQYGAVGLALGAALGSYVNLAVLTAALRRRLGALYTPGMWASTGRTAAATALAAIVAFPVRWLLREHSVALGAVTTLPLFALIFLLVAQHWGSGEASRWLRRLHLTRR
jgi:putative peptidoglycan lipid II flippase